MATFPFSETALFTPTEAAVLTHMPLKAVNNAIDKRTVPATAGRRGGQMTRLLDRQALISLLLERRLASRMLPEFRREIFRALAKASGQMISVEGGLVRIDLREPRRELAAALRAWRRVRRLVHSDPEIMGGQPVFKGTRVSPHLVATLLGQGSSDGALLTDYPSLTAEMVSLAPVYAAAYPERGRPRRQSWHGQEPTRVVRRKLSATPAV